MLRDLGDESYLSHEVKGSDPAKQRGLFVWNDSAQNPRLLLDCSDMKETLGTRDNFQSSEKKPSGRLSQILVCTQRWLSAGIA